MSMRVMARQSDRQPGTGRLGADHLKTGNNAP
jgi:hypothetical protein